MPQSGVAAVSMQRKRQARLAAGLAALTLALGALAIAEGPGQDTTYAGHSGVAATLTLGVGVALILAGLATSLLDLLGGLAILPSLPASSGSRLSGLAGTTARRCSAASACLRPVSSSRS